MSYTYHCGHCHEPIHNQTRLVTDELGLSFYHVTPDCYELHKKQLERHAYANAITLHSEEDCLPDDPWFTRNAPHYNDRGGNGG